MDFADWFSLMGGSPFEIEVGRPRPTSEERLRLAIHLGEVDNMQERSDHDGGAAMAIKESDQSPFAKSMPRSACRTWADLKERVWESQQESLSHWS